MVSRKAEPRDEAYRNWIFTIPNIICMLRAVGSIIMLVLALMGLRYWFIGFFVILTLSDWIDGTLARWLKQRSDFGARIDSFADATLYGALLLGTLALSWATLRHEWWWFAMAVLSYVVTSTAGLIKYGKIPSYHTLAAKRAQPLVLLAGIALVLDWSVWPMRLAAIAATLTNIEATAMTAILPEWHADVLSFWEARDLVKQEGKQRT